MWSISGLNYPAADAALHSIEWGVFFSLLFFSIDIDWVCSWSPLFIACQSFWKYSSHQDRIPSNNIYSIIIIQSIRMDMRSPETEKVQFGERFSDVLIYACATAMCKISKKCCHEYETNLYCSLHVHNIWINLSEKFHKFWKWCALN